MDPVKHIEQYIIELLYEHECVILPGFGGFITKYSPTLVNDVDHRFDPPSISVRFNISLKENDGLLVNHVAVRERIPYDEAREYVDNFSYWCRRESNKKAGLRFSGLGHFYLRSGSLVFHPELTQNLNADSFGLAPVTSPPIHRDVPRRERVASFADRKPRHPRTRVPAPVSWTVGVAIPIIVFLLWGIINPAGVNQMRMEYSGLVNYDIIRVLYPFNTGLPGAGQTSDDKAAGQTSNEKDAGQTSNEKDAGQHSEEPLIAAEDLSGQPGEAITPAIELTILPDKSVSTEKEVAGQPKESVTTEKEVPGQPSEPVAFAEKESTPASPDLPHYYIIGGSFRRMENAEVFSGQLENSGFDPHIVPINEAGNIRVSYGIFTSKKEALSQLRIIRGNENPDAWLLKN